MITSCDVWFILFCFNCNNLQRATDQQDGQHGCDSWLSQVKKYKHLQRIHAESLWPAGRSTWLWRLAFPGKKYKHFLQEITPELTKHAGYRYTKCKHAVLTSYIGHSYDYIRTSSKQPKPNMNKKDILLTFQKSGCIVLKSASKSQHIKELKVALFHSLFMSLYLRRIKFMLLCYVGGKGKQIKQKFFKNQERNCTSNKHPVTVCSQRNTVCTSWWINNTCTFGKTNSSKALWSGLHEGEPVWPGAKALGW